MSLYFWSPAGDLQGNNGDPNLALMSKSKKKRLRKRARDAEWNVANAPARMLFSRKVHRCLAVRYCLIAGPIAAPDTALASKSPHTTTANIDDITNCPDSNDDHQFLQDILNEFELRKTAELQHMVQLSYEYDLEKSKSQSPMAFKV